MKIEGSQKGITRLAPTLLRMNWCILFQMMLVFLEGDSGIERDQSVSLLLRSNEYL